MRKTLLGVFFLLFILLQGTVGFASHGFGGELLYTHLSGNTYKVTLTLYGDCSAPEAIFQSLYSATPAVTVKNDAGIFRTMTLKIEETGTDVSPVCSSEIDSTKCHGGSLPGVRRFKYSDTVTLPGRSATWAFVFSGNMGSATQLGRSGSITNIISPPGLSTVVQLVADLDNSVNDNSSPDYSSIPTPFYCINVVQQYNQGAIDADGDSLAFSLVSAFDANTNSPVNYASPYSGSAPLASAAGSYSFSSLNGQISFTPSITQDALVVCRVSEYRNGTLIGTSERELTFIILDNCQGVPPTTKLNVISGGSTGVNSNDAANVVNVCVNTANVSFDISLNNPGGDKTTLTATALPPGSNLIITDNNTPSPHGSFEWSTSTVPVGVYTFYLTVQNDHCPLATRTTVAYTINVTPFPEIGINLLAPTQCLHKAYMEYNFRFGYTPRTITIMQDSTINKTYSDSTGKLTDSLPAGKFTITCSSNPQCSTTLPFNVSDSGFMPLPPIERHYCINGHTDTIDIHPIGPGAIVSWFLPNGATLFYPPIPDTKQAGTTHYYFTEQYQHCMSDLVPVSATVHVLPVPEFSDSSTPATICLGDTIMLKAIDTVTNTWTPKDQVLTDATGNPYIRVMTPVDIQLKAEDIYGCADSVVHHYKDIQYCCLFSYPNAFTPNGDGRNDGFRIVSYGNTEQYNLIIYNRWGQQVFHTSDPRQYWDGTFNGTPCDLGTYVYYFTAKCVTGNKEETRGDVILIR